mmetsp:Transcript_22736/g.64402  ORF Transcript_22736/g.64402 Transcript_22736/m.64402 type:complete len:242 (+) Transcript_22736:300-1025(+)|eukprot:CAMPEP_0119555462 /NCGR_PEP_ID=MMETSP1352-20130426/7665_1 /TAXON_ID=265584 /ORGANISM="Stauroneis constricta, Strain CCMP1120" /LENGTH=241 /DNA_ID=CAMNT_0007602225 /DNA_START=256 /DNA_END=981 /DNA_ORIENTATION=-
MLLKKKAAITSSELSQAITQDQWDVALGLCQSKPESAKVWTLRQGLFEGIKDSSVLPLHEALVGGAPYAIVAAILNAYNEAIYAKESSYKRLPLHCACRKNAMLQVVDLLLKMNREAALIADNLGRLPIHYALSNGANDLVIDALLKAQPNSARGFDKRGWTPLHVACGVGASTHVIKSILSCYPEAVIMRTQKGSTAMQCLNLTKAANKKEVQSILKKYHKRVDAQFKPAAKPDSERVMV